MVAAYSAGPSEGQEQWDVDAVGMHSAENQPPRALMASLLPP